VPALAIDTVIVYLTGKPALDAQLTVERIGINPSMATKSLCFITADSIINLLCLQDIVE
jgi:hypothetical protein